MSSISLSFIIDNGHFHLLSSSENDSLDGKVSEVAGEKLKQIIDYLSRPEGPIKNSQVLQNGVCVELTPEKDNYFLIFKDIQCLANRHIILNPEFVKKLSGTPEKNELDDWVLIPTIPPGIQNPTKTDCFMNAVFQVVMSDDLLKKALIDTYKNDRSLKAQALMAAINGYAARQTISTATLRQFMPQGVQKGQQDASEFLDALLQPVRPQNHSALYTPLTTTYKYLQVDMPYERSETNPAFLIPIKLDNTNETIDGTALIKKHFEEKPFAEKAEGNPDFEQLSVEGTPNRLVFSLNRFFYEPSGERGKINSKVQMPEIVVINGASYALKKVILHHGKSMSSGHYTTLMQNETGQWLHADDKNVLTVNKTSQDLEAGYIYFYELIEG